MSHLPHLPHHTTNKGVVGQCDGKILLSLLANVVQCCSVKPPPHLTDPNGEPVEGNPGQVVGLNRPAVGISTSPVGDNAGPTDNTPTQV